MSSSLPMLSKSSLPLRPFRHFFKPNSILHSKSPPRPLTTSPLPLETIDPYSPPLPDHKSLCFSLLDSLISKGQFTSAQSIINRLIKQSSSVSDIADVLRGLNLELVNYSGEIIIQKLVELGEYQIAEAYYNDSSRGIVVPDPCVLECMVICFCRLGKVNQGLVCVDELCMVGYVPSRKVCDSLLVGLCRDKRFGDAYEVFFRFVEIGVSPSEWCYKYLIDGLCLESRLDDALDVFDEMCELGVLPTCHLYKTLVYSFCKRGWVTDAEVFCRDMEMDGFCPDRKMFTSIMKLYCKEGNVEKAMGVFKRMEDVGFKADAYAYNTLLEGFFRLGDYDLGLDLCKKMVDNGFEPNVVTYSMMMKHYCKQGKVDFAWEIFKNLSGLYNVIPNVQCYTILMEALYKNSKVDEANDLFNNMLCHKVAPDHVLYLNLAKNYPKGQSAFARVFLEELAKFGHSSYSTSNTEKEPEEDIESLCRNVIAGGIVPVNEVFSILVCSLCATGKTEDAWDIFKKMLLHGCTSLSTYNSLIKNFCRESRDKEVKFLISVMRDQGLVPNMATYLVMVQEYCKQKNLKMAFEVLDDMEESSLKPSVAIYDPIIAVLFRERRIPEAETIYRRMCQVGVLPDEVMYCTLINGLSINGKVVDAKKFYNEMKGHNIRPSAYAYTALINGLVKKNMFDEASEYLEKMLHDGHVPGKVLYTALIHQFCRKGDVSYALRLDALMRKNQVDDDVITDGALISGVCKNVFPDDSVELKYHDYDRISREAKKKIFSLLGSGVVRYKMRDEFESPQRPLFLARKRLEYIEKSGRDLHLYNAMINGYCRALRLEEAYEQFELLMEDGLHPNHITFTILINAHIQKGDICQAIDLFNMMSVFGCVPDKITYDTLIKGLCTNKRAFEALSLVYTMNKRGLFPSKTSYEGLLNHFCDVYASGPAVMVFEEMFHHGYSPSLHNYNRLLCNLLEDRNLRAASYLVRMMLKIGKAFTATTKILLLKECYEQRDFDLTLMIEQIIPNYEDR